MRFSSRFPGSIVWRLATCGSEVIFRGLEFGESQKDLLRACAREEIDINVPFEELPKADQTFVIEGERRSGDYTDEDYENDRWYGVRGFFRWLASRKSLAG